MIRRNLVPNPIPNQGDLIDGGFNSSESNTTQDVFTWDPDGIHYAATATDDAGLAVIRWNNQNEIVVRGGERYALSASKLNVITVPTVGYLRFFVQWYNAGGTHFFTSFGPGLNVGDHGDDTPSVFEAPATAVRAMFAFGGLGMGDGSEVEFIIGNFMFEPLGPPDIIAPGADFNLVENPDLEKDISGWVEHTSLVDQETRVYERQSGGWSKKGSYAMRMSGVAKSDPVPDGLGDFVGTYILPISEPGWPVIPGETYTAQVWNNIIDPCLPGSPGCWVEIFYYFYDGDPAHTEVILQANGPSLYTYRAGEVFSYCTATAPEGANIAQMTSVMRTAYPDDTMDFSADCAMFFKGDTPKDYFDGDSPGAGWTGYPQLSKSVRPGRNARLPGAYLDGSMRDCQWEGVYNRSMSSLRHFPLLEARLPSDANMTPYAQLIASTVTF